MLNTANGLEKVGNQLFLSMTQSKVCNVAFLY